MLRVSLKQWFVNILLMLLCNYIYILIYNQLRNVVMLTNVALTNLQHLLAFKFP